MLLVSTLPIFQSSSPIAFAVAIGNEYRLAIKLREKMGAGVMRPETLTSEELTELTAALHKLARNLWWTWDQGAQEIFQELSPRGWQNLYHNAVAILHEVSEQELRARLQSSDLAERTRKMLRLFEA